MRTSINKSDIDCKSVECSNALCSNRRIEPTRAKHEDVSKTYVFSCHRACRKKIFQPEKETTSQKQLDCATCEETCLQLRRKFRGRKPQRTCTTFLRRRCVTFPRSRDALHNASSGSRKRMKVCVENFGPRETKERSIVPVVAINLPKQVLLVLDGTITRTFITGRRNSAPLCSKRGREKGRKKGGKERGRKKEKKKKNNVEDTSNFRLARFFIARPPTMRFGKYAVAAINVFNE